MCTRESRSRNSSSAATLLLIAISIWSVLMPTTVTAISIADRIESSPQEPAVVMIDSAPSVVSHQGYQSVEVNTNQLMLAPVGRALTLVQPTTLKSTMAERRIEEKTIEEILDIQPVYIHQS